MYIYLYDLSMTPLCMIYCDIACHARHGLFTRVKTCYDKTTIFIRRIEPNINRINTKETVSSCEPFICAVYRLRPCVAPYTPSLTYGSFTHTLHGAALRGKNFLVFLLAR